MNEEAPPIPMDLRRRIRLSQARDTVHSLLRTDRRTAGDLRSAAELAAERHSDADTTLGPDEILESIRQASDRALAGLRLQQHVETRVRTACADLGIAA